MDKVLVTYASRTGSTEETAGEIARILSEDSARVDLLPINEVTDLSTYHAAVVGSAIQSQQWLPEAVHFVRQNRSALQRIPVAMFTLCMTLAMKDGEKYRPDVLAWLAPVRSLVQPVSEGLFAGALDIRRIPSLGDRMKFRMSVLFGVWKEGDHRDLDAIHSWAEELRDTLQERKG
jgi:menaquinone-dependent protoporphyrinogen oxidase